jgi:hypothetical protein
MKIFLSVGRTYTDAQETFVRRIEDHLRAHGLVPQTVGRSYFSSQQPLKAIDILMNECVGSVVVALERTFIAQAVDRRGSPKESVAANVYLPTVWNQIEAAMAYVRGHPLLVLLEDGLKPEGLLEKGYDWYVLTTAIDRPPFSDAESTGVFADWKARVAEAAARKAAAPVASHSQREVSDDGAHRRHLTHLRKQLATTLNDDELETLCFDLGVDYENLKGDSKEAKARELVLHCDRAGKLSELNGLCQAMRPNVVWNEA